MIPLTPTDVLPLETDADGVVRVGDTRVTLDTIIMAFTDGATAEEIAQQYPSSSSLMFTRSSGITCATKPKSMPMCGNEPSRPHRSANTMKPALTPPESATAS